MPRFQFRLSTLLWITLAVACWFGGMRAERWLVLHQAATTVSVPDGGTVLLGGIKRLSEAEKRDAP